MDEGSDDGFLPLDGTEDDAFVSIEVEEYVDGLNCIRQLHQEAQRGHPKEPLTALPQTSAPSASSTTKGLAAPTVTPTQSPTELDRRFLEDLTALCMACLTLDLCTVSCGGHKSVIGPGGNAKGPLPNCEAQGNVLVLENDGEKPEKVGCMNIDFVDPVNLDRMGLLNVLGDEPAQPGNDSAEDDEENFP